LNDPPDTIVLIHGLWMTPPSWEGWIDRYTKRGYWVIVPDWPETEGPVDELGLADIVDHYASIIAELDRPPIIMGHALGGAFTEILLDRGLGAAGVSIDGAALEIQDEHAPLLEIAGSSRFIVGQDGWDEVADFALSWAVQHARTLTRPSISGQMT
jgi:pimeloyl-ACP methyl ester carboxylesterase